MTWKLDSVRERSLSPACGAEEYRFHAATFEWSLADPFDIRAVVGIPSRPRGADRFEQYPHQQRNLNTVCGRLPVGGR